MVFYFNLENRPRGVTYKFFYMKGILEYWNIGILGKRVKQDPLFHHSIIPSFQGLCPMGEDQNHLRRWIVYFQVGL